MGNNDVNDLLIFKAFIENEIKTYESNFANINICINNNDKNKKNTDKIYSSYANFSNQSLNYYKNLLSKTNHQIFVNCKHNWIKDYIDVSPEESQQIIYCTNCMLTKHKNGYS